MMESLPLVTFGGLFQKVTGLCVTNHKPLEARIFWSLPISSADDPMAKRALQSSQKLPDVIPLGKPLASSPTPALGLRQSMVRWHVYLDFWLQGIHNCACKELFSSQALEEGLLSPLVELRRRLGLSPIAIVPEVSDFKAVDEQVEKLLIGIGSSMNAQAASVDRVSIVKVMF